MPDAVANERVRHAVPIRSEGFVLEICHVPKHADDSRKRLGLRIQCQAEGMPCPRRNLAHHFPLHAIANRDFRICHAHLDGQRFDHTLPKIETISSRFVRRICRAEINREMHLPTRRGAERRSKHITHPFELRAATQSHATRACRMHVGERTLCFCEHLIGTYGKPWRFRWLADGLRFQAKIHTAGDGSSVHFCAFPLQRNQPFI